MSVPASERMQQPPIYSSQAINEILETLDNDIRDLARRKIPRSIVPPEILDIEVDELAQRIRIKLWSALQKVYVVNLKAYTIQIARTVAIDMARKYQKSSTVPIDDYCEQGEITTAFGYGMQDPAIEYEQKESFATKTEALVNGIHQLPPQQRYAMLCDLKDCAATIPLLMIALVKYDLGLELIHWPTEEGELKSIRTSHSIARSKLKVRLKRENLYQNRPVRIRQDLHPCG
jgi:DNA-directed RNA polymerase specialized sigma24 family protein